jgi:uncharacterized membrane protein YhaH (DUF805 family)
MEGSTGGILGRLSEKVLGWIALGLLIALGFAIYQMGEDGRAALWSGIWRTIAWLLFVAALPWVTKLFIRRLLDAGTNWAGAALIGGYIVVDAVFGLILLGGWPGGGWGWVASLAALAVAGTYNFLVSEYLADQAAY